MTKRAACSKYVRASSCTRVGILLASFVFGVTPAGADDAYYGNYRLAPDHMLGIDHFIDDAGENVILFSDYRSGIVRRLFPAEADTFVMGPGFEVKSPVEQTVALLKNGQGEVTALSLLATDGASAQAERVSLGVESITIESGDAKLAGTLLTPTGAGPHPAIILLHGSGPLTRYSFGPYPHFFTSLGFAVLIYDKRGTGDSSGPRPYATLQDMRAFRDYPEELRDDVLAALRFLKGRADIDPKRVGLWGSSEGGMLTTQVAARSKDVAFIIDSSGFMGPLWQTIRYQKKIAFQNKGMSKAEIAEGMAFTDMWMRVARTGVGWRDFMEQSDVMVKEHKPWLAEPNGGYKSIEQMHWHWDHFLAFSPLPALKKVTCPVLAVYGQDDVVTETPVATRNMRRAFAASGNRDVTIRVFANAGHSLAELPSGSRMAPGLFDTLGTWLLTQTQRSR